MLISITQKSYFKEAILPNSEGNTMEERQEPSLWYDFQQKTKASNESKPV